jgi:hypothetical protein
LAINPFPFPEYPAYDADLHAPVMSRVIPGYSYPERFCPYCERKVQVINAIHAEGDEEVYKAIMVCMNDECGAFDEPAKKAYLRVYYSCELAREMFEVVLLRFQDQRRKVE